MRNSDVLVKKMETEKSIYFKFFLSPIHNESIYEKRAIEAYYRLPMPLRSDLLNNTGGY